jgi:hypothetical protein
MYHGTCIIVYYRKKRVEKENKEGKNKEKGSGKK